MRYQYSIYLTLLDIYHVNFLLIIGIPINSTLFINSIKMYIFFLLLSSCVLKPFLSSEYLTTLKWLKWSIMRQILFLCSLLIPPISSHNTTFSLNWPKQNTLTRVIDKLISPLHTPYYTEIFTIFISIHTLNLFLHHVLIIPPTLFSFAFSIHSIALLPPYRKTYIVINMLILTLLNTNHINIFFHY